MNNKAFKLYGVIPLAIFGALVCATQSSQAQTQTGTVTYTETGNCTFTAVGPANITVVAPCPAACATFGTSTFNQPPITVTSSCTDSATVFAYTPTSSDGNMVTASGSAGLTLTLSYPAFPAFNNLLPFPGDCVTPSCRTVVSQVTIGQTVGGIDTKASVSFTNTLCVVESRHVVFAPGYPIKDDNVDDNLDSTDCSDSPSTPQIVNRFTAGQVVEHHVQILDCSGNDVTVQVAPLVRVMLDLDECIGSYYTSTVLDDVPESANAPDGGVEMVLKGNHFQYNVSTKSYPTGTIKDGTTFFRSCVEVLDRASGAVLGREDAILESK